MKHLYLVTLIYMAIILTVILFILAKEFEWI